MRTPDAAAGAGSAPYPSYTPVNPAPTPQVGVAESGSYYGELNANGVPKTVHVNGYYRKDGTYVREHYRSAPRSNPPRATGRKR